MELSTREKLCTTVRRPKEAEVQARLEPLPAPHFWASPGSLPLTVSHPEDRSGSCCSRLLPDPGNTSLYRYGHRHGAHSCSAHG